MTKLRLDQALVKRGLIATRSQAESYIKLGDVLVDNQVVTKPGFYVHDQNDIKLLTATQYVSRAGLKLASVARVLGIDFQNKIVLDVGSSTGGFTDYALRHGAKKVIAVEAGTNQLHKSLRDNLKIELHEQTDIRDVGRLSVVPDIIVVDVSFISLREIIPHLIRLITPATIIIVLFKPQFEAVTANLKHKGVIKNDRTRRDLLKKFEQWVSGYCLIVDKDDSKITGVKGNKESFYKLRKL